MVLFFYAGIASGGYDPSGSVGAENLSIDNFTAQNFKVDTESVLADSMAPQMPATEAGTELAFYTTQLPTTTDFGRLLPFNALISPSTYVFYKGGYLGWSGFTSQFPSKMPGLWIERAVSWSWYATLPLGGWARELLYLPTALPISIFEVYPDGYVTKYDPGSTQPGFYYLWYYADAPGRHLNVLRDGSIYSNIVVIDVYGIPESRPVPPKPIPPTPDPKLECEKKPLCFWDEANKECICTAPNPVAECEKNPYCQWSDGQCLCTMPNPDDSERAKCEQSPNCDWIDGQCICRSPGPIPGPSPAVICQQNPGCIWENGRCICSNPEPIPGPVPNPEPAPEPVPNPDLDSA